jgi:hypothetical protein
MQPRRVSAALVLGALVLLAGLLAGCGGGGESGGNQSEGGSQEKGAQGDAGAANNKNAPEIKIAVGTVTAVRPDRSVIVLMAVQGQQSRERMVFKLRKEGSQVELDGEKAGLSDAKEGQQAQIEYVVRKDRNRARVVDLFSAGGAGNEAPAGGGEETG